MLKFYYLCFAKLCDCVLMGHFFWYLGIVFIIIRGCASTTILILIRVVFRSKNGYGRLRYIKLIIPCIFIIIFTFLTYILILNKVAFILWAIVAYVFINKRYPFIYRFIWRVVVPCFALSLYKLDSWGFIMFQFWIEALN